MYSHTSCPITTGKVHNDSLRLAACTCMFFAPFVVLVQTNSISYMYMHIKTRGVGQSPKAGSEKN